jgi:hypothetical protein
MACQKPSTRVQRAVLGDTTANGAAVPGSSFF